MTDITLTPAKNVAPLNLTQQWDKTFKLSDQVEHHKVTFRNRYGITLAADLYVPKNAKGKLPAIVLSGPFGAVKEQSSGLHAHEMAKRGFVTLAFDPSFTGESGGEVRDTVSPDIFLEDFSAAVDFIGLQSFVDRDRIGVLAICGLTGMGITAATADSRIKAVATTAMYDMSRSISKGYQDYYTPEVAKRFFDYYKTPRGFHPRSINSTGAWTATTPMAFFEFNLIDNIKSYNRPLLLVTGDKAHSRYYSETVYENANQPKELVVTEGADHVDLYDNLNKIPFDKFEQFLKRSCNKTCIDLRSFVQKRYDF